VPVLAVLAAVSVNFDVPEPGAAIEDGLKLPVTPVGKPEAESAIAELKLLFAVVVTVTDPLEPRLSEPEVGETEMEKLAATGAVTINDTEVVFIVVPEVPVTVML
jgi:hypothetical protein